MAELEMLEKELWDVHKVTFLMQQYPGKTINEFADMFLVPSMNLNFTIPGMSIFEINVAIWRAADAGFITIDDPNFDGTGHYTVHEDKLPDAWNFGTEVKALLRSIPYLLEKLNKEEGDIMERQLQQWFAPNFARHDYTIALKFLLNAHVLASYDLTNVNTVEPSKKAKGKGAKPKEIRDTYTFYTLWANGEQRWGLKQFPDQSKVE
jgi:hypothetical protein